MAKDKKTLDAQQAAPAPSKRDAFRSRIGSRYPELNLDDEDAYYDQMGKTMDEFEGYEESSRRLRESMGRSPMMSEMLIAARNQDDFDPVVWMVRHKGLDLAALQDDPEYADKLAEAHSEYLAKQAKGEEIESAMATNLPKSIETIRAKAAEMGLSDEQAEEIVGKMYQTMDDMVMGILSPEIFELLAKGSTHDEDVTAAREEGVAEGLNTKVDDKLRTLSEKNERVAGVQKPMRTAAPAKKQRNMFMAYDEDEE